MTRLLSFVRLLLFIALASALATDAALAATAAGPVTIDLAPIISQVILPIITSIALGLMGWAAGVIATHFHVQISQTQRDLVDQAIANGLAYAQTKLGPKEGVPAAAVVAEAVNYVLPKIPGALAWLKITPDSLTQLVTARLPQ